MNGDIEGLPGWFRDQPELRTLTVTACTEPESTWTTDRLGEVGSSVEEGLRGIAGCVVVSCVTCEYAPLDEQTALRIRSVLETTEAPLHAAAAHAAQIVSNVPGVETDFDAVSWHISAPASFQQGEPRMLQ